MFRFQRFYSVFKARNREFYRDIGALIWAFFFPFMMIFAFSNVFKLDEGGFYKVGYLEVKPLANTNLLQWITIKDQRDALNKLRQHRLDLLVDARVTPVQVWVNEESFKSKTAEKILRAELSEDPKPIQTSLISGTKIKYVDWLLPGLIAMNTLWLSFWGIGWVIVRHRKTGVLKRFKTSPLTPLEYLLAQMSSRLIVLSITGVLVFAGAHIIHPFPNQGSYFDLFIVYFLGCICHCGIGMLVAARTSSEELANGILNTLTYPMVFLSEIWFSLEGSVEWVLYAAKFVPLWHMTDGMRRIMFEGASLLDLWPSLIAFTLISTLALGLGSWYFRWVSDQ